MYNVYVKVCFDFGNALCGHTHTSYLQGYKSLVIFYIKYFAWVQKRVGFLKIVHQKLTEQIRALIKVLHQRSLRKTFFPYQLSLAFKTGRFNLFSLFCYSQSKVLFQNSLVIGLQAETLCTWSGRIQKRRTGFV